MARCAAFSWQLNLDHDRVFDCGHHAQQATSQTKETDMKLLPALAVIGVLILSPTAFAQTTPTNKADCEKAKMKWDAKGGADKKGACVAATPAKTDAKK
jgi:hypothetical protein